MILSGNTGYRKVFLAVFVAIFLLLFSCPCVAEDGQMLSCQELPVLIFEASRTGVHLSVTVEPLAPGKLLSSNMAGFSDVLFESDLITPEIRRLPAIYIKRVLKGLLVPDMVSERIVWFVPETMEAVARLRWKSNRPEVLKVYRWEEGGVRRWKIKKDHKTGKVVRVKEEFYDFTKQKETCSMVSDPALLPYMVSLCGVGAGNKFEPSICVFGKKAVHQVSLKCVENNKKHCVFSLSHKKTVGSSEHFSMLGLEDDILIQVDETSRLPVMIRGDNTAAGDVTLRLTRVSWQE